MPLDVLASSLRGSNILGARPGSVRPQTQFQVRLEARLKALQIVQNQIWKPLAAAYQTGNTSVPHPLQIGDSVYVRRHQSKTLEPHWKGPYTVVLTTLMALKVDGVSAWIHMSHVKRAPPEADGAPSERPNGNYSAPKLRSS